MTGPQRSMTAAELLNVTEVERLALRPGDILVFKCPRALTPEEFEELSSRLKERFPDTKAMFLEGGMDVAVLRAEA